MNRIAARAMTLLILILAMAAGVVFFVGEYLAGAGDWVLFSGSPHVYTGGKLSTGVITDRDGLLLADLKDGRSYSPDSGIRASTLHWVGDRLGNIQVPMLDTYTMELLGYDPVNGLYAYGETDGTMKLTLSAKAQAEALEAMGEYIGTVAVYNYETGEILCAVTTPTYDPENVPDIEKDTEGAYTGVYINRFLQSKYIPGSIFKTVTLAIALETLPDIETQTFICEGSYEMSGGDVTCEEVHGKQTLKEAFCNSCNCAFAQVAEQIGREKLERYVTLMGITDALSFDGITTAEGNFETEGATAEQVAWSAIGQHKDQVNPCAFMTFMGAIAGDGTAVMPYVVSEITVGDQTTYEAHASRGKRILSAATAKTLQEYLGNNVQTRYGAENFPDVTICAKTGTAEVGGEKKPNATLAGFVADERYPLAFIAVVEDGGFGRQVCIPIVSKVLQACMDAMDGI